MTAKYCITICDRFGIVNFIFTIPKERYKGRENVSFLVKKKMYTQYSFSNIGVCWNLDKNELIIINHAKQNSSQTYYVYSKLLNLKKRDYN